MWLFMLLVSVLILWIVLRYIHEEIEYLKIFNAKPSKCIGIAIFIAVISAVLFFYTLYQIKNDRKEIQGATFKVASK